MAEQLGAVGRVPGAGGASGWAGAPGPGGAPAWATAPAPEDVAPAEPVGQGARPGGADAGGGDAPSVDDEDLDGSGAVGQPVIESVLGGRVIAINDDPVA